MKKDAFRMNKLHEILTRFQQGELSKNEVERLLKMDYIENLDEHAQLDLQRRHRTGIPEVILAETKELSTLLKITQKMLERTEYALISRVTPTQFEEFDKIYSNSSDYSYHKNPQGRVIFITKKGLKQETHQGRVGIITAGSSDIPVAEEARMVLEFMGFKFTIAYDVGIAGMHRIFPPIREMLEQNVDVIIVVAGMEGTLPGVVSSLVDVPVIGVPTSTGYGLGEKGIGALTTMLQSCSPGLAVVNIDNGFGAASIAALILKRIYP